MPTIAEIIAAKKAAQKAPAAKVQAYADNNGLPPKKESLAEKLAEKQELDALDARLAPVKPEVATSARNGARLVLRKELPADMPNGEPRGQATPIVAVEDERRSLSATEGEAIPMTPASATDAETAWHAALNAFESELCLMRDPKDAERAWIAVRLLGQEDWPILLKSLPLYEHPRTVREGPF